MDACEAIKRGDPDELGVSLAGLLSKLPGFKQLSFASRREREVEAFRAAVFDKPEVSF